MEQNNVSLNKTLASLKLRMEKYDRKAVLEYINLCCETGLYEEAIKVYEKYSSVPLAECSFYPYTIVNEYVDYLVIQELVPDEKGELVSPPEEEVCYNIDNILWRGFYKDMDKEHREIYTHQLCLTYRDKIKLKLLEVDAEMLEVLCQHRKKYYFFIIIPFLNFRMDITGKTTYGVIIIV